MFKFGCRQRALADVIGCLLIVCYAGANPLPASEPGPQSPLPKIGARIYVVAVRDSSLFTLCPSGSSELSERPLVMTPRKGDVSLATIRRGGVAWLHVRVWDTGESAMLPLPAGVGGSSVAVDLDRGLLASDDETSSAIARELAKAQRFVLAASLDVADYVLLVEAQNQPRALFRGQRGTLAGSIGVVGGDREANFREAILGLLVPAEEYRKHGPDPPKLLGASVWTGAALAYGGPRAQVTPAPAGPSPASAPSLVSQLHGDGAKRPSSFPAMCPALSQRTARSDPDAHIRSSAALFPGVLAVGPSTTTTGGTTPLRGGVTYVTVPVLVKDQAGRAIAGLSAADFRVYEGDREQKIDRLSDASVPVNLALLVDTSASMRSELSQLQNAILRFVGTLQPHDTVMLASFDERVRLHTQAQADRNEIRPALFGMDRRAGTRLYDAMALMLAGALERMGDRKAIVLLSDGVDTRSRLADAETTLSALSELHVPVYVIQYDTSGSDYTLPSGVRSNDMGIRDMKPIVVPEGALDNTGLFRRADAYLTAVSELSGGRLYRARSLPNLNGAFTQIVKDLVQQYTLGYYPANQARDGSYRKLRVDVNRPAVVVTTRRGYRAPSK